LSVSGQPSPSRWPSKSSGAREKDQEPEAKGILS
jgi:hypothetical protein